MTHRNAIRRTCCVCGQRLPDMTFADAEKYTVEALNGQKHYLCGPCRKKYSDNDVARILSFVPPIVKGADL